MSEFSKTEVDTWVKEVSALQNLIHEKLITVGFLDSGEDDSISHRLAETTHAGTELASRTIPTLLSAEGQALSDISVDLVADLQEIREALDAMEPSLIRLMNFLNA